MYVYKDNGPFHSSQIDFRLSLLTHEAKKIHYGILLTVHDIKLEKFEAGKGWEMEHVSHPTKWQMSLIMSLMRMLPYSYVPDQLPNKHRILACWVIDWYKEVYFILLSNLVKWYLVIDEKKNRTTQENKTKNKKKVMRVGPFIQLITWSCEIRESWWLIRLSLHSESLIELYAYIWNRLSRRKKSDQLLVLEDLF